MTYRCRTPSVSASLFSNGRTASSYSFKFICTSKAWRRRVPHSVTLPLTYVFHFCSYEACFSLFASYYALYMVNSNTDLSCDALVWFLLSYKASFINIKWAFLLASTKAVSSARHTSLDNKCRGSFFCSRE